MILYIDETENSEFFIVSGLLANSKEDIELAYSHFKKIASKMNLPAKIKPKLFTEFKSTLLDKNFQRLKIKMLEEINNIEHCIIYSCYIKKESYFSQEMKEEVYIKLLAKIVMNIESDIDIIFDTFNKSDFETRIIDIIGNYSHVKNISPCDSQIEHGLQFIDNLCSVLRYHKSDTDINSFYDYIKEYIQEV